MAPPPLRIAILKADTPIPAVDKKYGGYAGIYESWLRRASQEKKKSHHHQERELRFSAWDVVDEQAYPELEEVDVVVITGSSMLVNSTFSLGRMLYWLQVVVSFRRPVFLFLSSIFGVEVGY